MNVPLLASLLRERARLHGHERWSRDELAAHQTRRLAMRIRFVDAIPRTALGKAPLIRHAPLAGEPVGTH